MSLIELKDLSVHYGPIVAVKKLNASFKEGAITCILGANGAGKSSTLKCLAGLVPPNGGQILFDGKDVTRSAAHDMVGRGLTLVPEGRRLFPGLTVYENLRLGAYTGRSRQDMAEDLERVYSYFPRVHERRSQLAGSLSGGEQQMVAIGRALMSRPRVLLLDEPSLGLAPKIIVDVAKIVRSINSTGITVIIVEQNARLALRLSSYGYVLETGRLVYEGASETLLNDDRIKNAYLGKSASIG
ncbi:ABC transporter ATP-binding protein [Pusillimonas sp. MFBS29]|uniref:ABC transporter ATP-binding protein n=1 Tax=Pusillimonas sp. MFBS29 TaxID=2886690 RepID=UPI001D1038E4|nr:ABC transporter ATP-binding protein [Pusillimonas sp. MFBS29]MCC2595853.1 ABC transporter ATP-binding protein [Pusillimonas sp. MFBS29]